MVSFIVIGRNEGWKLVLCFNSVLASAEKSCIRDFEILYIDSQSTDDSINVAKTFDRIRIFSIEGKCNAAIARNVGGKEARGDVLVFLDGDMELNADFLSIAVKGVDDLIYPFLTGIYRHYYYDKNNRVVQEKSFQIAADSLFEKVTGGFFIITKELWQKIEGMDSRLDRNEDIDLGLRLCKINMPPLKLANTCINHYTSIDKFSTQLGQMAFHYRFSSVLARKHLLNIHYLALSLRTNYTSIFLFAAIILTLINYYFVLLYFLLILIRAFVNKTNNNMRMIFYYFLRDVVFVFSFFFIIQVLPRCHIESAL